MIERRQTGTGPVEERIDGGPWHPVDGPLEGGGWNIVPDWPAVWAGVSVIAFGAALVAQGFGFGFGMIIAGAIVVMLGVLA